MRSLLLFFLGVPIPIIILIALFVHWHRKTYRRRSRLGRSGVFMLYGLINGPLRPITPSGRSRLSSIYSRSTEFLAINALR